MSQEDTALSTVDTAIAALTSFGFGESEPMKPSNLVLIQKSDDDNPSLIPGKFMDVQSNMLYDSLDIVPISMGYKGNGKIGRTLFPDDTLGSKPLCRSNDGEFPIISEDYVRQDGGLGCKKCSKSPFKKINGKNIRPECGENLPYLFAELQTGFIFRYHAKGMSLSPMKDHKETIRKTVMAARSKGEIAPPYTLVFKLASVKIKGAKGTYYIPKFTMVGRVNPDDVATFANIYTHFTTPRPEDGQGPTEAAVGAVLEGEYEAA